MSSIDERLTTIAKVIISAYNGSFKPHIIQEQPAPLYYRYEHSPEGFILYQSENNDDIAGTIMAKGYSLGAFVVEVFRSFDIDVKWSDILKSKAVWDSIAKNTDLISPENHRHAIDDVYDMTVIADVVCYVYKDGNGKFSLRPAYGGSGMAVDAYCMDIRSYGKYGDFEECRCPSCGNVWYINVREIPYDEKYETTCRCCNTSLMRKKIR